MLDIRSILDSLLEIVYVIDEQTHEILYINKACRKLLGDCEGKLCYEVLHGDSKICSYCPAGIMVDDKEHMSIRTNERTGRTYTIREHRVEWDGKAAHLIVANDISNEAQKTKDLEMRLEMEQFIVQCMLELHREKDFSKAFDNLLEMIGKFLEAERVYVFDYDGVTMSNIYEWCEEGVTHEIDNLQNMDAHLVDRWIPTFDMGECVMMEDVEEIKDISPAEYKELARQGIKSIVAGPLENNGKLIGYIGVDNPPKEAIRKGEVFFIALSSIVSFMMVKDANEKKLKEMSYRDNLTKLYNRNKFIEDTEEVAKNSEASLGVLYMDLNGLKEINDSHGHHAGDRAIKKMASAISDAFGKEYTYRVGGDEFVAVCPGITEDEFLENVARLKGSIAAMKYESAIGYQYSSTAADVENIIKIADEKMYQDKKIFYRNKRQTSRYRFRNDVTNDISTRDMLRKLISEERFVIWFQPRFSLKTGRFCGSEALVRYFDEGDVIVAPSDFIPAMEYNETVHMIDFYVFRHVCEYISGWLERGEDVKPVSVNISHRTMMKPKFIENLMNIWYDYNIPKELIIIEISEDAENGGIAEVVDVLAELKKYGFRIAIDDFGAKYADLYLFAELKFDILKFDKDLVCKIESDEKTRNLARSVTHICRSEKIRIVAEGVENEEGYEILKQMGCDEAQGYLMDKPMSWNKFEEKYLKPTNKTE